MTIDERFNNEGFIKVYETETDCSYYNENEKMYITFHTPNKTWQIIPAKLNKYIKKYSKLINDKVISLNW